MKGERETPELPLYHADWMGRPHTLNEKEETFSANTYLNIHYLLEKHKLYFTTGMTSSTSEETVSLDMPTHTYAHMCVFLASCIYSLW